MTTTQTKPTIKIKKTYTFGKFQDAEVTVFFGTSRVRCVRHDPVGTYDSVETWHDNYDEAHGVAKLHAMMMNVKYN